MTIVSLKFSQYLEAWQVRLVDSPTTELALMQGRADRFPCVSAKSFEEAADKVRKWNCFHGRTVQIIQL